MKTIISIAIILFAALFLAGCSSTGEGFKVKSANKILLDDNSTGNDTNTTNTTGVYHAVAVPGNGSGNDTNTTSNRKVEIRSDKIRLDKNDTNTTSLPDLIVSSFRYVVLTANDTNGNDTNNTNQTNATSIRVFATVKNIGNANTAGTFFRTEFSISGQQPRSIYTPAISAGKSVEISNQYEPFEDGVYTVSVYADILDTEHESNEYNNQLNSSFTLP